MVIRYINYLLEKRKKQNIIMNNLLEKLENTNDWLKDGILYTYKNNPNLVIEWGVSYYGYDSYFRRYIKQPIYMKIPYRYRKNIEKKIIDIIDRHYGRDDDIDFLMNFFNNEYNCNEYIDRTFISEITIWLINNEITDYKIIDNKIWFKNIEDSSAYKLKWQ